MKKLLHFAGRIYNVNIIQPLHGSVSAIPISGTSGTEVTLSNTPDEGYSFYRYDLTGATLYGGNKFLIKNSDVDVQGLFKQDLHEYANFGVQSWTSGGPSFTLPPEESIPYKYIMFKQYLTLPYISALHIDVLGSAVGSPAYFRTINSDYTCIMGIRYNVTNFTPATEVISEIAYSTRDGYRSYHWTQWPSGTEKLFRVIYDIAEKRLLVYVNDTYLGYGTMDSSLLGENMAYKTYRETATPLFRNVRVVGGDTIEDLLAYTDGD